MSVLTHGTFACLPILEDPERVTAHKIFEPLRSKIYGMLLRKENDTPVMHVTEFIRHGQKFTTKDSPVLYYFDDISKELLPNLQQIEKMTQLQRRSTMLKILNSEEIPQTLSEQQILLMAMLRYWIKATSCPRFKRTEIRAVISHFICLQDKEWVFENSKPDLQRSMHFIQYSAQWQVLVRTVTLLNQTLWHCFDMRSIVCWYNPKQFFRLLGGFPLEMTPEQMSIRDCIEEQVCNRLGEFIQKKRRKKKKGRPSVPLKDPLTDNVTNMYEFLKI